MSDRGVSYAAVYGAEQAETSILGIRHVASLKFQGWEEIRLSYNLQSKTWFTKVLILCPKCSKTHLRVTLIPKIFLGLYPGSR